MLYHQKHGFKETQGCLLFKSHSAFIGYISAHSYLWKYELTFKWTTECHRENDAVTHKIEYIIFMNVKTFFKLFHRDLIYILPEGKKKISLQHHWTSAIII